MPGIAVQCILRLHARTGSLMLVWCRTCGGGAGNVPPLSFVSNLGCGGSAIVVRHRPGARSSAIGAEQHRLGRDGGGGEEIPAVGTLPLDHAGWRLPRLSVDRPCCGLFVLHAVPF
jgi:hypothetical protein